MLAHQKVDKSQYRPRPLVSLPVGVVLDALAGAATVLNPLAHTREVVMYVGTVLVGHRLAARFPHERGCVRPTL
jgi:hypothetical protein